MGPIGRKLHFSLSCRCESGGQGRKNFQIRLQVVCSTGKLLFYLVRVNIFFVASLGRRNYIWIKIHSVGKIRISFFLLLFFFFFRKLSYLQAIGFEENIFERIEGFIFIGEKGVIELFDFDLDTIKMEKR